MNNYESYKETDIPWLGEIPSHWEIKRANIVFEERVEKVSDKDYEPLSVTKNGIFKQLANVSKTNNGDNRKKVLKNDFVINSRSDRKGSSGLSQYDGSVSLINIVLKIRNDNFKFIHYLLKSIPYQEEFYRNGKGIVADLWSTNFQSMSSIFLPIPPISEQIQIANYLDWKINEIDRLILIEKKQIKELNHHKKLLISYEYSKQNKKRRIKTLLAEQLLYGINETGKENGNIRFVRITDIDTLGNLKNENILYLNKCDKKFLLIEDDILFARSGATVGKTYLQKKETSDMAFAGYLIRARINKNLINPKYVYYYFQSQEYEIWKESIFIQSTIQNISAERFANLEIPFADKLEQNIIIKRVKNINAKTEKILNLLNEKISNLQALKQSLIAEVVTGKIDVRNITIPQYEKVETIFETDNIDEMEVQDYGD